MDCKQYRKIIIFCLISAFANGSISYLLNDFIGAPLYADTIFTVAMCFTAGMLSGILTGAILSPLVFIFIYVNLLNLPFEIAMIRNIFVICIVVEVLLVCYFHKKMKPKEAAFLEKLANKQSVKSQAIILSFIPVAAQLLVLVVLACIVVSILGGIIDFAINQLYAPWKVSPEDTFKLGLLRYNVPLLLSAILSRIPINIVDRFIVVFGGYGISLLFRKWVFEKEQRIVKDTN